MNREQKRVQIVTLKEAGLSVNQIAKKTSTDRRTVQRVCKRVAKIGYYKDMPRSGRPSKLSARDKRVVTRLLNNGSAKNATDIKKKLKTDYNIDVHRDTVANTLRSLGYVARIKQKKPSLTLQHKKKRLEWAKKFRTWTVDEWKNVIWSDESKFNIFNSDGKEYYWINTPGVITSDSVKPTKKYGGGGVSVWSCITWHGVGMSCKIEGNMDSVLYSEILEGELEDTIKYYNLDKKKLIFQQDNDPKHTSHLAQTTLSKLGLEVFDWPSQSPDLNPIEHFWNHVDRNIRSKNIVYSDKNHLWEELEKELEQKNVDFCKKIISTMPERINDVINAKGGWTKW